MALCATTALAGAVPRLCVRGARGRIGGVRAGTWRRVSFVSPSPPRVFRAACDGPSRPGVPYPRSLVRHSMRSVRSARSVRLPFRLSPRVPFVCVRSRSRGVRPPPRWVAWRAHLAWSRHWALVGPFHVVRAPPRVLPRSLAPSGVLGGGRSGPGSPLLGLGLWGRRQGVPGGVPSTVACGVWGLALLLPRLPVHWVGCRGPRCGRGRAGVGALLCPCGGCTPRGGSMAFLCWGAGWGGGACAVSFGCAAGAGPVGRGVALPLSVPLPSLGRQQSGRHWRCAVHGGRGPPYHSGSCSPGFSGYDLCGVPLRRRGPAFSSRPPCEPAAGAGGRVTLRLPSRAGGAHPPCLGGWGPGPPGWRAGGGAGGGRCRAAASLLSLRAAACGTPFWPSPCRRRAPFQRARAAGAEVPPRGGGGEGRPVDRSPGGPS